MSPRPTQMRVIRRQIRGRILHASSEAEDLYVLIIWRFLFRLKKTLVKDGFMKLKMYACKREDPNRGIYIFTNFSQ